MRELDDTKGCIREGAGFGAKIAGAKRPVVLAMALALAVSLCVLGGITGPASARDTADLLPDLRMGPIQDLRIRESPDGRRLLRYSTLVVNIGAGPFELHGQRPDTDTKTMTVTQRVYDDAGGYRDIPTSAVMFFSGDGHDHWHVRNFQRQTLKRLGGSSQVRVGAKEGFCVYDFWYYNLTLPNAPQKRHYLSSRTCGERKDEEALKARMGLSVGWVDKYSYFLPYQWIDISGLPSGTYRLRALADWRNRFKERREDNNYTWTVIELKGNKVNVLREGPHARYCGRGRWC